MNKIEVKVIPGARRELIVTEGDRLKVYLVAPAVEGKANDALIRLLSVHFKVRKSGIRIVRGHRSRVKLLEINEE